MVVKQNILIVDDEEWNRELLSCMLDGEFKIALATSGPQGLELAFSEVPDLILLDIMMPALSGIEVCK